MAKTGKPQIEYRCVGCDRTVTSLNEHNRCPHCDQGVTRLKS